MVTPLPAYEICLRGYLDERYQRWFEGMDLELLPNGDTRLSGVLDPAALHGILNRIRDLNLQLILVRQIAKEEKNPSRE